KQSWGPGYLAVAWRRPDGVRQEPIPGAALIPYSATTVAAPAPEPTPAPAPAPTPTPTPTPISGSKVRVTFTFSAPPASATSRIAPTLYNKSRVLQFEEDDSPAAIFNDVYPLLKGGVRNGQTYPGLRYTDGCGNARPYTAAVAINGHNTYNNSVWLDPGTQHDASRLVWAQAQELLNNGWDVENHSDLHTATNPAQQISALDGLIANNLQGYKTSVHIVPTNFAGYPTAAFAAGYVAVSSNSQSDNFPMLNAYNGNRVALSALPSPSTPFVYNRYMADQNTGGGETNATFLSRLKTVSDNLMAAGSSASEVYLQRVFTHGMTFSVLADWMNYTQSIAQDRLWVTTLREFAEYRRVSAQVVKTEVLSGNTLTVDLDYAGLSANTRFQNLTLLVTSAGTISNISVTGAQSATYNKATKMVNVFRTPPTTSTPVTSPTPEPTPTPTPTPSPTGCTGTGSLLREQWSNLSGTGIAAIPVTTKATSSAAITQFATPNQTSYNNGARIRGYVCPPLTGTYTFWIVGDETAELYLSTSADPTKKVRIAYSTGWTSSASDFTRMPSQQSVAITLQAGTRYYIESLHKQGWGAGYLAVAWRRPDGVRQEPIPSAALIPYSLSATTASATATTGGLLEASAPAPDLAARPVLGVFPNPLRGADARATVEFALPTAGPVTLELFSLQGQRLRRLYAGPAEAGAPRQVPLDAAGLAEGLYLLRLTSAQQVLTHKIQLTR
ncbi:T9SS type A sorting domain-containing protein, partial [Hymenobacter sp. BT683]